jgi:hypothetical protein
MEEIFGPLEKMIKILKLIKIKFFRRTAGYILVDHKRSEEILEVLTVDPVDSKIRR